MRTWIAGGEGRGGKLLARANGRFAADGYFLRKELSLVRANRKPNGDFSRIVDKNCESGDQIPI